MASLQLQFPALKFRSIGLDLSKENALEVMAEETKDLRINLVFNNAGYIKPGLFASLPIDTIMSNYHTNATVTIKITHHYLNLMMDRKEKGLICFTGSSGGFIPGPMSSIYSSTKAWMTNFSVSLAAETAEDGIDVLCIHPSPIASNFYDNASSKIYCIM
jgi:short-subunit dehydrogenase